MLALLPWLLLHAGPANLERCPSLPLRALRVLDVHGRPLRDMRLLDGNEPVARTNGKGLMRVPEEIHVCRPVLTGDGHAHIDLSKVKLHPDAQGMQTFTLAEVRRIDLHVGLSGKPCDEITVSRAGKGGPELGHGEDGLAQVELPLGHNALQVRCGSGRGAAVKEVAIEVSRVALQDARVDLEPPR